MKAKKYAIILFLAAIGGYTAFWHHQSNELANQFKSQIDRLAKNENQGFQFDYESIERGGFPFEFSFALINPKITALSSDELSQVALAEISMDGKFVYHLSVFGELKSVDDIGKTLVLIPENDENPGHLFQIDGKVTLETGSGSLVSPSVLSNLKTSGKIPDDIWENLNLGDGKLHLKNLKIIDLKRNKTVTAVENAAIQYKRKSDSENHQSFLFEANIEGWDFYPSLSYLYAQDNEDHAENASAEMLKLVNTFNEALYSQMGKIDFDFDLNLGLPKSEKLEKILKKPLEYLTTPIPSISLEIKSFTKTGAFGDSHFTFEIATTHEEPNSDTLAFNWEVKSVNTKEYVKALELALEVTGKAAAVIKPKGDDEEKIKELLTKHTEELAALVPKINELGTIEQTSDFQLKFDKDNYYINATLSKLALLTELYGAQFRGAAEGSINAHSGFLTLDLYQFQRLLKDLADYSNRAIKLVNAVSSTDAQTKEITPEIVGKITSFIQEISNKPDSHSKDAEITATYKNDQTTIGTLSLEEAFRKYEELAEELKKEFSIHK